MREAYLASIHWLWGGVVTISSLGSVITPSLIGGIASHAGIQMGMAVLLVPAAAFALAVWNWRVSSQDMGSRVLES